MVNLFPLFYYATEDGSSSKKGLTNFHFSKNMFSFSKWVSEWAFIFKMCFFFKWASIFKIWKVSWGFFPFSEKHTLKFVNKNLYSHYKQLYWWGCVKKQRNIYKAFKFFLLSRIYNLLYLIWNICRRLEFMSHWLSGRLSCGRTVVC